MNLLIEIIREHEALYNPSHHDYMNAKYKEDIWGRIAKELSYTNGKTVKEIWRKLRDCHRDALRRQSKKKSAQTIKPWTYQEQMKFLIPYMNNRQTTGNVKIIDSIRETDQNEEDASILQDCNNERNETENFIESTKKTTQESVPCSSRTDKQKSANKKRKIDNLLQKTLEHHAIRSFQRDEKRKRILLDKNKNDQRANDSLYQFFLSMYNDAKNLPKGSQFRIKRKLFDAVQLEEEAVLLIEARSQSLDSQSKSVPISEQNNPVTPETDQLSES